MAVGAEAFGAGVNNGPLESLLDASDIVDFIGPARTRAAGLGNCQIRSSFVLPCVFSRGRKWPVRVNIVSDRRESIRRKPTRRVAVELFGNLIQPIWQSAVWANDDLPRKPVGRHHRN